MLGTSIAGALGDVVGIVPLLTLQGAGYIGAGVLVLWAIGTGRPSPNGQVVIHPGA